MRNEQLTKATINSSIIFCILRIFFIVTLVIVSLIFPYYYRLWTKPYRLSKSNINLPFHPEWEISLSREKKAEIKTILSQQFNYLGKGFQSYAFLSEDGKYVLKLFRLDHCKVKHGQHLLEWIKRKLRKKVRITKEPYSRATEIFKACKISYDFLQKETGLIFIHLNPSLNDWPSLKVRDHLGLTHFVDPSVTRFVLQRKAVKMFPALYRALKEDRASFYRMISSFASLLNTFESRGIGIEDAKMPSNFGFLGEQAMQIDFASNSDRTQAAAQQIRNFRFKFSAWLDKHAPDAISFLDHQNTK